MIHLTVSWPSYPSYKKAGAITASSESPANPPSHKARKSLGQHFLADRRILARIAAAADLTPADIVIEIGPGHGDLTRLLLEAAGRVVAVELDHDLAAALPQRLERPANLTVIEADARDVDIGSLVPSGQPYKVAGNLPYYAANPIIRRFLEAPCPPALLVILAQQEVARQMAAAPGEMSLLSVATQFYAVPKLVFHVPPGAFRPPPKVTSTVVRLDVRPRPAVAVSSTTGFFRVVRAGFSAPRKQLRNSLANGLGLAGAESDALLAAAGLDGRRRAETLTLAEWGRLYAAWERAGLSPGAASIEG